VEPRLNAVRVDDAGGQPIAGWVRFAAHPAGVIFDAPISAEYPGYMCDHLRETVAAGSPVLFGYGASGDVNCLPMSGRESDSRNLGLNLASPAASVFDEIQTSVPRRLLSGTRTVDLPLDSVPSEETLDSRSPRNPRCPARWTGGAARTT